MKKLFIHPTSKAHLEAIASTTPQAILLCGPSGVGLRTIASAFAGKRTLAHLEPKSPSAQSKEQNISVEAVRDLYLQTRSKQNNIQFIVIDDVDAMSHGAQNAFLKLLEEPTKNVHFILTSHRPGTLLPTIHSRVQNFPILPLTPQATKAYLESLGISDPTRIQQLLFLASGLPAELSRLVADETYFTKQAAFLKDAQVLLAASRYEKLVLLQRYQNNKADAIQLLDSAGAIVQHSLNNKPQPSLIEQLTLLIEARERVVANGNVRLQLARFVL